MKTESYLNEGFDNVKSKRKPYITTNNAKRTHKKLDDSMLCKQEVPDSGALSGSSFE